MFSKLKLICLAVLPSNSPRDLFSTIYQTPGKFLACLELLPLSIFCFWLRKHRNWGWKLVWLPISPFDFLKMPAKISKKNKSSREWLSLSLKMETIHKHHSIAFVATIATTPIGHCHWPSLLTSEPPLPPPQPKLTTKQILVSISKKEKGKETSFDFHKNWKLKVMPNKTFAFHKVIFLNWSPTITLSC